MRPRPGDPGRYRRRTVRARLPGPRRDPARVIVRYGTVYGSRARRTAVLGGPRRGAAAGRRTTGPGPGLRAVRYFAEPRRGIALPGSGTVTRGPRTAAGAVQPVSSELGPIAISASECFLRLAARESLVQRRKFLLCCLLSVNY
eukprot:373355-Hanusia_phi.AAC.1